jgi:hypothetical protein
MTISGSTLTVDVALSTLAPAALKSSNASLFLTFIPISLKTSSDAL